MGKDKQIPLDEKFRILFRIYHDIIERRYYEDISQLGLSVNQFIILKIVYGTGPHSVSELADALHISNAASSKNIDILVRKRLVGRKTIATNRRKSSISINAKGGKLMEKYNLHADAKINSVLDNFSKNELNELNELIDKFIFFSINSEENLSLFCMQCGGKYKGDCPVKKIDSECYFNIEDGVVEKNHFERVETPVALPGSFRSHSLRETKKQTKNT